MDLTQIEKYKALGLNVSYYRRKRELTQEQLAELLSIERNHVSNVELARAGVSLDVIFHMADVLEVPVHKLFEFRD
jgi:transcriptional regulator with XRE-family HTH domain